MAKQDIPMKKEKPQQDSFSGNTDIASLKKQVDDQQGKIDSIWNLISDKKQVEQILEENDLLRKRVAEKDGLLKVLKDKLTEKTSLLNAAEQKNQVTGQEIEEYKRQVFEFSNKIGSIEKRVFSTDEQNQKLLYELMNSKERLKQIEAELAGKDSLVESQSVGFAKRLEAIKKEEEEKKLLIMKDHSKKVAVLNAAVDSLKSRLEQQNRLLGERTAKESALIADFHSKMGELISAKQDLSVDVSSIGTMEESTTEEMPTEAEPDTQEALAVASAAVQAEPAAAEVSRVEEIVPMIELALDHGDTVDRVKRSLSNSGFSVEDIEEAFSRVNLVEQE